MSYPVLTALPECVKGKCCSENLYREERVSSWKDLVELYNKIQDGEKRWVFRGQENSTWCLTTSLERLFRKRFDDPLQQAWRWERLLLRQFARAGARFFSSRPESPMEWLAVMRHYGGPTRLLDWTYSFWIALYFALEKADHNNTCALWALDVRGFKNRVQESIPELKNILAEGSNTPEEFAFILDSKNKTGIWPVNPFRLNERLFIQQGVFLLPLDVTSPFMKNLQAIAPGNASSSHLFKIVIPFSKDLLSNCLTELHRMNIDTETLFPGPDGFARNFANLPGIRFLFDDLPDSILDKPLTEVLSA